MLHFLAGVLAEGYANSHSPQQEGLRRPGKALSCGEARYEASLVVADHKRSMLRRALPPSACIACHATTPCMSVYGDGEVSLPMGYVAKLREGRRPMAL